MHIRTVLPKTKTRSISFTFEFNLTNTSSVPTWELLILRAKDQSVLKRLNVVYLSEGSHPGNWIYWHISVTSLKLSSFLLVKLRTLNLSHLTYYLLFLRTPSKNQFLSFPSFFWLCQSYFSRARLWKILDLAIAQIS